MKLFKRTKHSGYESISLLGLKLYKRISENNKKRVYLCGIPVYSRKIHGYIAERRVLFLKFRKYDELREMQDMLSSEVAIGHAELESRIRETKEKQAEIERSLLALQSMRLDGSDAGTPAISVIMPVWNVSAFLKETMESILCQTFQNFELICVDDGSTDASADILDEYAALDKRIAVIHQQNGGAGAARNRGLELAKGKYILFLDADDIYSPDMFASMLVKAELQNADVVVCRSEGFTSGNPERWLTNGIVDKFLPFSRPFSGRECASYLFQAFIGWPWDKMFRCDLLKRTGLRYPETRNTEDAFFIFLNLAEAKRIAIVPEVLAFHRSHSASLEAQTCGKTLEHIRVYEYMADWLREKGLFETFKQTFFNFVVKHGIWSLCPLGSDVQAFRLEMYKPFVDFLGKHFQPASYPSAYYYNAEHFDFIHSMFVKKPCSLRYSVVSACYNVEKYIDEMLESLVWQTVDFEQNIECILVDDGSTDGTADKIKEWESKYSNIRYVYKENGGVSSARNAGLAVATCPWVTFIDPDDFIHPDYFHQIDSYLSEHEEETAFVAGRIISYFENHKKFSSHHSFDHKFKNAVNVISIHDIYTDLQFAANSAFFNRDIIINNSLEFPHKCKPKFEDANFICKYIYIQKDKNAVFLKNSLYFYRKREDSTSLLDTSWMCRESYGDLLEYGYIDICNFYIKKAGNIPIFLQNMIMYELCWFFRTLANKPSMTAFLSDQEVERFWELFSRLVLYLDENSIAYGPWEWIWRDDRVPMIERILNKPYPQEEYLVQGYDASKNLLHVSHVEAEGNSGTVFINGIPAKPVFTKVQKRTLMRRDWADITHEYFLLDGYGDTAEITARMADGRICDFLIPHPTWSGPAKFWGQALSLPILKESFAIPPVEEGSRFADAWLIMDRDESADDNGEHFYRWLMKNHPEQRAYFVLRKEARDWMRLEKEGFVLVDFNSPDYEELFKNCSKIISAHGDNYIFSSFPEHRYKDFVFLQHGVTKNDLSWWMNGFPATLFLTSAKREYDSIAGDFSHYKYSKKEVSLTGMPRHDALLTASIKKRKQILIMPTWRNYIVGSEVSGNKRAKNPAFMETAYFRAWHSLLHCKQLKELSEKYGFEVVFYPHQNCQPYLEEFDCPDYIRAVRQGECGIQELFLNASVMITDFSSVAMDMAYAERAVLYYQFDEEEFFRKHWEKGYFDYRRDGFGPVAVNEEDVLCELEKILENGGNMPLFYKERVDSFFAYRDGKSCERTYEAICNLDSPVRS